MIQYFFEKTFYLHLISYLLYFFCGERWQARPLLFP
nr:MAG TPA: hypothetical protein [Caudoviricetes sp.]